MLLRSSTTAVRLTVNQVVVGSNPTCAVFFFQCRDGGIGRHNGLKIR